MFFVMGAPKSGTTWVQHIMNAHPQVSCFGEGHFVDQVAIPFDALAKRYNQKLALVSERVYSGAPAYAPLSQAEIIGMIRQLVLGLMRRAGPDPQALWWGDKTPAYGKHLVALDRIFPGCRFIDIVRDPRDIAVSALYHAKRAKVLTEVEADLDTRRELIKNSILRWREHVEAVSRHRAALGPRLLEVQYQRLIDQPEAEVRRLFAHLEGASLDPAIIADIVGRTAFEVMSGGRKPGEANDESFFRAGTYGRYLSELRPEEARMIEAELGGEMERFGLAI